MQSVTFWIAVVTYALATVAGFVGFALDRPRAVAVGRALCAVGLVPHAVALALRWQEVGHGPYHTRYEVLSADVFLLVLVFVVASQLATGLRGLGVFVAPLAVLGLGFGVSTFDLKAEVPIIFKSTWLWVHVGFAKLFGVSALLASGAAAAWLAKRRRADRLSWLPGPAALELYAHQLLLVAFLFLGVMIAAGALWANQSWGRYWNWDPMETSALVTWLAFGVILHFHALHGWRGERMVWLTFAAGAFTLVTLFVVAVTVPTIHTAYMVGRLSP
jgi:ABC-type transport system involved in cytochrome c biogenesis permease subunit